MSARTVLVVDDEVEIANAVRSILEDEGYDVVTAPDGAEALKAMVSAKPDLVLMDIMMPKMSGYDVLGELHRRGEPAPVVLMSCVTPQVKKSRFGWSYFLKKPFTIEELLGAIEHCLSRR